MGWSLKCLEHTTGVHWSQYIYNTDLVAIDTCIPQQMHPQPLHVCLQSMPTPLNIPAYGHQSLPTTQTPLTDRLLPLVYPETFVLISTALRYYNLQQRTRICHSNNPQVSGDYLAKENSSIVHQPINIIIPVACSNGAL